MSYLNTATYRERERQWQEQAAELPPGRDRDACLALAGGYRNLIAILERLEIPPDQRHPA
jgi:hypothetical protein